MANLVHTHFLYCGGKRYFVKILESLGVYSIQIFNRIEDGVPFHTTTVDRVDERKWNMQTPFSDELGNIISEMNIRNL